MIILILINLNMKQPYRKQRIRTKVKLFDITFLHLTYLHEPVDCRTPLQTIHSSTVITVFVI